MMIDQDYVCGDYGTESEWTQVKVTVKLERLDDLVAIMSMVSNNLQIEDYSDIDLKTCYGDLIDGAQKANEDAETANNGWPKELREYPGGTATEIASYRTEISGTTKEEMLGYIEQLKADGYVYTDFYDFGLTEDDMLGMDGWWGTNGEIYLSLSYYEGTVTVDHTYELPNLEDYFG